MRATRRVWFIYRELGAVQGDNAWRYTIRILSIMVGEYPIAHAASELQLKDNCSGTPGVLGELPVVDFHLVYPHLTVELPVRRGAVTLRTSTFEGGTT